MIRLNTLTVDEAFSIMSDLMREGYVELTRDWSIKLVRAAKRNSVTRKVSR